MKRLFRLFGLLLLLLPVGAVAAALPDTGKPDVTLEGEVRFTDLHHYIEAPFVVPAGTSSVTVVFSQDGAATKTVIDLGLRDPERFRGWSGGGKARFVVSETDATPSYLPGPLPAGRWVLVLGAPNIRAGVVTRYQARISFGRPGAPVAVSHFSDAPLRPGPAWFRGDLHSHTAHSDGSCLSISGARRIPCPVFRTLQAADARKLDFVAVSDHDTASQNEALRELQPYFDRTLVIPAQELTTFTGHANALGVTAPIDFRVDGVHVADANALADAVHRAGGLFSINHPALPSAEICMGCGWTAPGFDFARADAVEVVNGGALKLTGTADGLVSGLPFWRALLDKGLHPTAVGGSDNHDADTPEREPALGSPTTVVWASELSERAILAGLKAGHVFIDVDGDPSRRLEFWADMNSGRVMMGDRLALAAGRTATLTVQAIGAPGGRIELMRDGSLLADPALAAPLEADTTRALSMAGDGRHHWIQALVRDEKGRLILISNPIYLDGR